MDTRAEVSFQRFASSHEITTSDIGDGNPLMSAQSLTTGSPRSWLYPLPLPGGFRTKPAVDQEPKLPAASASGVEHLEARELGMQDCLNCIENLLVQGICPAGIDQLCGDSLKVLSGVTLAQHRVPSVFALAAPLLA
jgi:hypothetical protein